MKWRRSSLDPEVKDQLELRPREKVLAWVDDGFGRAVVASETALHLQRTPPSYSRFGWEQVERASYDSGTLTVVLVPEQGSAALRIPVGDERELPVVVRDRVTATVVVNRFVPLRGDAGVRIVGRRREDGQVQWRSELDPGLADDPGARQEAAHALEEVRAEVVTAESPSSLPPAG
jgi:hypothetical protein